MLCSPTRELKLSRRALDVFVHWKVPKTAYELQAGGRHCIFPQISSIYLAMYNTCPVLYIASNGSDCTVSPKYRYIFYSVRPSGCDHSIIIGTAGGDHSTIGEFVTNLFRSDTE